MLLNNIILQKKLAMKQKEFNTSLNTNSKQTKSKKI